MASAICNLSWGIDGGGGTIIEFLFRMAGSIGGAFIIPSGAFGA